MDKSHKLTLRTPILNAEGVKKERENIGVVKNVVQGEGRLFYQRSSHLCKILLEVLIISFCSIVEKQKKL